MDAGGIMVRQKGLPENHKIAGTYSGSVSYGNIASGGMYFLTKDGRLTVTRTGTVATADATGHASNTKSGTYNIKGNTLRATYSDGWAETANIGLFSGTPAKMVLNGTWMTAE